MGYFFHTLCSTSMVRISEYALFSVLLRCLALFRCHSSGIKSLYQIYILEINKRCFNINEESRRKHDKALTLTLIGILCNSSVEVKRKGGECADVNLVAGGLVS